MRFRNYNFLKWQVKESKKRKKERKKEEEKKHHFSAIYSTITAWTLCQNSNTYFHNSLNKLVEETRHPIGIKLMEFTVIFTLKISKLLVHTTIFSLLIPNITVNSPQNSYFIFLELAICYWADKNVYLSFCVRRIFHNQIQT